MKQISIAEQFTRTPGGRFISHGLYSGEQFRKEFLEPLFTDESDSSQVEIILDGVLGYATSFLEEAFGGLARVVPAERVNAKLVFTSKNEPFLIDEIHKYIQTAEKPRCRKE